MPETACTAVQALGLVRLICDSSPLMWVLLLWVGTGRLSPARVTQLSGRAALKLQQVGHALSKSKLGHFPAL